MSVSAREPDSLRSSGVALESASAKLRRAQEQEQGEARGVSAARRIAALLSLAPGGVAVAIAWNLDALDLSWAPMWLALAAFYVCLSLALWTRQSFARDGALALAVAGLLSCTQGLIVAGTLPLLVAGVAGHALWLGALLLVPRTLGARHALAVGLATAAFPAAMIYALSPNQDPTAIPWILGGAGTVFIAALGIARQRTWGLLLAPLGAVALASTVLEAPSCGCLEASHPMLPNAGLAVAGLGAAAALASAAVFLLYLVPIVRWLLAGSQAPAR